MGHDGQTGFFGDIERDIERLHSRIAAGGAADTNLDAEHQVLVLPRHAHGLARIDQTHVDVFAEHDRLGEGEDAGERNVDIRQDANRRSLDDMPAKAMEVSRAGAAGVDESGDAAAAGQKLGFDAERRAAPIDMRVQVDEARRHDLASDVANILARKTLADRGYLATGEGDVSDLIERLRRVDDAPAL